MRQKKRVALLTVCMLVMSVLIGCGNKFDASKYVQAQMDNSYKNDSSLVVEEGYATKEEAEQVYEDEIDTLVDNFFYGVTVSEDVEARYNELFRKMLDQASYTVGEATKQSDGSYVVSVEYKKMKVFEPAMTKLQDNAESLANSSVDEYFTAFADYMEEAIDAGLEYGDTQTMDFRVDIVSNTYTLNTTDIETLNNGLFDFEAVTG